MENCRKWTTWRLYFTLILQRIHWYVFPKKKWKIAYLGPFFQKVTFTKIPLFPTYIFSLVAAALDTLHITDPSFTCNHISLPFWSSACRGSALHILSRWPSSSSRGERSCAHPHASHCKISSEAEYPSHHNNHKMMDREVYPKIFPKGRWGSFRWSQQTRLRT